MPATSLPPAQSKTSRRSMGLWVIGRAPWTPYYYCDHPHVRRPSGAKPQGRPGGHESRAPTGLTAPVVTPISGSTPHSDVINDTSNHRFDFGNYAAAFLPDREGEVLLWV
jgi:hypothetical protein